MNATSKVSLLTPRKRGREALERQPRASLREKVKASSVRVRYVPSADEACEIEALRRGDPEAMDRLVRLHSDLLYGAIIRLVRDPDQTQSLVQETFLQALRGIHTFRARSKLSTWLYSIAMNVTRGYLKKARRYEVLSEEEIEQLQPHFTAWGRHAEPQAPWNPEAVVEQHERARIVRKAIDRLPESYRMIVTLRDMEELSTAEVAQVLGISAGNVRVRLHRARNVLRQRLLSYGPGVIQ